jgi:hypothetical protein
VGQTWHWGVLPGDRRWIGETGGHSRSTSTWSPPLGCGADTAGRPRTAGPPGVGQFGAEPGGTPCPRRTTNGPPRRETERAPRGARGGTRSDPDQARIRIGVGERIAPAGGRRWQLPFRFQRDGRSTDGRGARRPSLPRRRASGEQRRSRT